MRMPELSTPRGLTRRGVARALCAVWLTAGVTPRAVHARQPAAGGSVESWRSYFPALAQRVGGHPLVYLDSAATTQRPEPVLQALLDFYRKDNANPGSALHTLARRASGRYENARRVLATFINASSPEEIVWVRGTTEGINLIASSWGRSKLKRGDEILLTTAEHSSNLLPWRLIAGQTGAVIRCIDADEAGRLHPDEFSRQLSERTRLVAFSHVSNVAGYVNPAAEICRLARQAGARVLVDAAQSAPHVPLDVQSLGCDFLTFSGHKMLAPMGIGVLWARRELLDEMPPYQAGSNMAHEVDCDSYTLEHAARRFGAGTPNVAGAIGLAAAVEFMHSIGRDAIGGTRGHSPRTPSRACRRSRACACWGRAARRSDCRFFRSRSRACSHSNCYVGSTGGESRSGPAICRRCRC